MGRRKKNDPKNTFDAVGSNVRSRLENCHTVVTHLESCPAWKIILDDLEINKQFIDDNWQDIVDEKRLQRARELKNAYKHLIDLRKKYEDELKSYKDERFQLSNREKEIIKDYDSEGVSNEEEKRW